MVIKYKLLTQQKSLRVLLELDDDLVVNADYQRVSEVLTNLFENAVKYTSKRAEIKVRASRQDEMCRVSVFNTCRPIDEKDLENLFISFYRGDASRQRDKEGYGLGLAIVKSILDMHGAQYGAQNIDDGVEFWFMLPIVQLDGPGGGG